VVLAGDAAHTIHPLAGQGVNLGFQDVAELADIISRAVSEGRDFADISVLKAYERRRKPANLAMQTGMDAFCFGFATTSAAQGRPQAGAETGRQGRPAQTRSHPLRAGLPR
jgi:2-octaprenyl-3-methyl-6-methoxy-1,4-benzoquinol hydroxylase